MGIEIFERAAEHRGRILRAERQAAAAHPDDPLKGEAFLLTFDVGRILVRSGGTPGRSPGAALEIVHLEGGEPLPPGLEDLGEEEPWWRVIGNPICGVWPNAPGEAAESRAAGGLTSVCLQFRENDENPKLIALRAGPAGVEVSVRERVDRDG